jgi:hypothetical protein
MLLVTNQRTKYALFAQQAFFLESSEVTSRQGCAK